MSIESINRVTADQGFQGNTTQSNLQSNTAQTETATQKELKESVKAVKISENVKNGSLDTNTRDTKVLDSSGLSKDKETETSFDDVKGINKIINHNTVAEFGYNEPTKRITIKIKDKDTNEIIKEIPSEKALEMLAKAWELAGILVDEKR